jgi:hypothetical protein
MTLPLRCLNLENPNALPNFPACQIDQMSMVCEKQNLGGLCQLGQDAKPSGCAIIVELHEEVVCNERQLRVACEMFFESS